MAETAVGVAAPELSQLVNLAVDMTTEIHRKLTSYRALSTLVDAHESDTLQALDSGEFCALLDQINESTLSAVEALAVWLDHIQTTVATAAAQPAEPAPSAQKDAA